VEKSAAMSYREREKGEFGGAAGGFDGDDGASVVLSHLAGELRGGGRGAGGEAAAAAAARAAQGVKGGAVAAETTCRTRSTQDTPN
jgi:hypothetical protein